MQLSRGPTNQQDHDSLFNRAQPMSFFGFQLSQRGWLRSWLKHDRRGKLGTTGAMNGTRCESAFSPEIILSVVYSGQRG